MRRLGTDAIAVSAPAGEQNRNRIAILAVGDTDEWLRRKQPVPPGGRILLAAFTDLSFELLDRIKPRVVLSPLLAREFDCIDLAQLLFALGFDGKYRVLSAEIPNPHIVKAEIRSQCPGLDFEILQSLTGE